MINSKTNSTNIRVTKKFTLDFAHALDGYDGLCKNIHGHTYHFSVTLLGPIRNDEGHSKNGFVIDFKDVKAIVKTEIIDVFDHSLVLNEISDIAKNAVLTDFSERIIYTSFQPTCENLLVHFVDLVIPKLPVEIKLITARLDETPSSYAEWFLADQ